jgi:hypothetical protein
MTPPWPVPRCTPHGNRHACDVASSAVVRTGRVSPYSERCCDRNRCLAASQPISVAGREIEESASRFPSDTEIGLIFLRRLRRLVRHTPPPQPRKPPFRFLGILPSRGASSHPRARPTHAPVGSDSLARLRRAADRGDRCAHGAGRFGAHMISVGGGVGQPADFCPGQGNLARIQRVISIC